jgi:hypothetical protein
MFASIPLISRNDPARRVDSVDDLLLPLGFLHRHAAGDLQAV